MFETGQHDMQAHKSYVKTNGTASIRCPKCSLVKNIPVGRFRDSQHTLKTRCLCGTVFMVSLDFRRHYRKPTQISGVYTTIGAGPGMGGEMQVDNISHSGVAFSLLGGHPMTVGQKALLNFRINDRKQTEITRQVIVRRIHTNEIGCEFANTNEIGKDLGFFIQP